MQLAIQLPLSLDLIETVQNTHEPTDVLVSVGRVEKVSGELAK